MNNWMVGAWRALRASAHPQLGGNANGRTQLRRGFAFEVLEPRVTLSAAGLVTTPQTYSGALDGKIVFTSGGHGIGWNGSAFATERPDYWQNSNDTADGELVEDFGNQDQMSIYADDLLRAGATVVPMRPVGHQLNEVVLDNDSPGVTFSGAWSNSTSTTYYDEDYGAVADTIPYKFANTTTGAATATATYTPNIPAAGEYPVYTWVKWDTDRTLQTYLVNHTGGTTMVKVDHSIVGSGWVYLGTYHFNAGSSLAEGSVQIINTAPTAGNVVIADAIRFGNGMGDYVETGAPGVSGAPREDEDSFDWIARSIGVGKTLTQVIGSDTNVSAPSDFAEYMYHGPFGQAVYIGFHSNGSTGNVSTATSRGAVGLYDNSVASRTPNQIDLATMMANQINGDMQSLNGSFQYDWTSTPGTTDSHINFGEIDLGANAEMDATIDEVAYHDNLQDNALLRDPKVRDQIARSVLQGTVQYFATYGNSGTPNVSLPTAPTNVSAVSNANGSVTISWAAPSTANGSVNPDPATGYKVYASTDGYGFDGGTVVAGGGTTSVTLTGYDPAQPYYFKVAATNAGGESAASEVVTVLPSGGVRQVLIVDGFDRTGVTEDFQYPYTQAGYATPDADGFTDRVWPTFNNSRNYVIQVASAIRSAAPGIHFASTSNEAVISGAIRLSDYSTVIWILGDESTADHTFDTTEQTLVTNFLNGGGNLFVSGSEIGWDLDAQNNGRSFYENTLKGNYVADDAGTYTVSGAAAGIFNGIANFDFSQGNAFSQLDGQLFNVATPDVIAPQAGATSALTYVAGTGGTAGIQVAPTGGKGGIVMFGFPFETIRSATTRSTIVDRVFDFFNIAPPNADLNRNGAVDAADYVLWRKTKNTTVPASTAGDADGNGKVNSTDYQVWRSQFGASSGAGSGASLRDTLAASTPATAHGFATRDSSGATSAAAFATRAVGTFSERSEPAFVVQPESATSSLGSNGNELLDLLAASNAGSQLESPGVGDVWEKSSSAEGPDSQSFGSGFSEEIGGSIDGISTEI